MKLPKFRKKSFKIPENYWTLERHATAIRYCLAIVFALLAGCLLFINQGEDPLNATWVMFQGGLSSIVNLGTSIRWATPCLIAGAAIIISFGSGVKNMGVEGQILVGGLAAALFGLKTSMPHIPHLICMMIVGGLAGAAYALLPALMRLYLNVNEMLITIMMNFLAKFGTYYYVYWIYMGGTRSPDGAAAIQTDPIADTARIGTLIKGTTASYGFIIALLILIILNVFYKYTIIGYEMKQMGQNMECARASGVNIVKRFFQIFLFSGFMAGVCGAIEVSGSYHYFLVNFPGNLGWEAFMVTNAAGYDPVALMCISCVWGIMKSGSLQLERVTSLSRYSVNLIQMLFILFVSVNYVSFFRKWQGNRKTRRLRRERREEEAHE